METNYPSVDQNLISKIKSALFKLISPEFRISDDTILQKLYDCISQLYSCQDHRGTLSEIFISWIEVIVNDWSNIYSKCQAFSLRILALICSNEERFCSLANSSILNDIWTLIKSSNGNNFLLILRYLELVHSLVKSHMSGCSWVFDNGIWKDILNISRCNQSLYALRQAHSVIADLVVCLGSENMSSCCCILDEILLPCFDIFEDNKNLLQLSQANHNIVNQQTYFHGNLNYMNSFVLFREVIINMLRKKFTHSDIETIIEKYNLFKWTLGVINGTTNLVVVAEMSRLLSLLNIALLHHNVNGSVDYNENRLLCQRFLEHIDLLVKNEHLNVIQEVCIEYLKLWNQFGGEIVNFIKLSESEHTFAIENTIIIILTVPLLLFLKILNTESDLMDVYSERIHELACVQTRRVGFAYKVLIKKRTNKNCEALALTTVQYFVRVANICKKEQGVLIFQTLVHVMAKIIPLNNIAEFHDMQGTCIFREGQADSLTSVELLTATLEALNCYISKFNLSWSESLETVCVMPLLQKLVRTSNISPRMLIDVLKLQRIVIMGYLPTNMALLMNTLQGTSVRFLGSEISTHLHSIHWEVRDSTLELLQAICILAEQKIPVFQQMILEDQLPCLLISIFQNDSEAYVRASALDCLSYMVRMDAIWEKSLTDQSLLEKTLHILLNDQEGIVRQKAILLLQEIYQHTQLKPEEHSKILDVLYHITIKDLHWEVTIGAISFWDCVLERELSEEGMVNGSFPDHIFSGKKKKIIKLTPSETSSRIVHVFESLSDYGCLYTLWYLVNDHYDLEVMRVAGKLISKMINLINKFNVPFNKEEFTKLDGEKKKINTYLTLEENKANVMECVKIQPTTTVNSTDEVIESIVAEGDINLVRGLLRTTDSREDSQKLLIRKKLSLNEFYCNVTQYDIIAKQIEKDKWLYKTSDGIFSLLDDILINTFDVEKNNVIDCY